MFYACLTFTATFRRGLTMRGFKHRLGIGTRLLLMVAISTVAVSGRGQLSPGSSGFDVASIRPTNNPGGRALIQATSGQLAMTNLTLQRLILIAYDIQDDQLVGDPGWIDSASYDIQAKSDGNPSVQQMEGAMLQSLLQDRFRLTVHRATRLVPVYRLSTAKGGPRLQPSKEGSCTPYMKDSPPPPPGEPPLRYCGLHAAVNGLNRTLDGKGVTMTELAASLSRAYTAALGRNVIDGTGLTGQYDIHLEWSMDLPTAASDDAGKSTSPGLQSPSIFTALEEQLGLRLESAKGPVEVVVIDHIEKPSEN